MKTIITTSPSEAAAFIKRGGIVAFPTETVYGLGADIFNEIAIHKIFEAKQRPGDNPLIAHISSIHQIDQLAPEIAENAERLIQHFFPGPLTVVLKKLERVPDIATAGLDSIAIRMPRNDLARAFLVACGVPVVAPSANLSGRPSPTTWQAVYEDLNGRIDCILQGDPTEIGLESTVIDCLGEVPIVLRMGAVSIEQVRQVVPETMPREVGDGAGRSPGLRHRHYSPSAKVFILEGDGHAFEGDDLAFIGMNVPDANFRFVKRVADPEEYAHELFEFFRECDRRGIKSIFCESLERNGIGAALIDRIERASRAGN